MDTDTEIQKDRRRWLALTGLSPAEFDQLLSAFSPCRERLDPADRTAASAGPASASPAAAGPAPCRAKKKPRGRELTEADKRVNRKLGRIRVRVAHALAGVKRCRIVKDVRLNTNTEISDSTMEAACGLHNLRVESRERRRKRPRIS